MRRYRYPALVATALAAALVAGPAPLAKLLYLAGYPGLALPLLRGDATRGAALYALGRYAEADTIFAAIGRSATYDRGLTLAATGRYALAVAYFDAVLFANRWDEDARHNRDIIEPLVDPVTADVTVPGRIAAILREAGIDAAEPDPRDPTAPVMPRERDTRKPVDQKSLTASMAWIETLSDAPGEYLRKRLAAERARREAAGRAADPEPSPW